MIFSGTRSGKKSCQHEPGSSTRPLFCHKWHQKSESALRPKPGPSMGIQRLWPVSRFSPHALHNVYLPGEYGYHDMMENLMYWCSDPLNHQKTTVQSCWQKRLCVHQCLARTDSKSAGLPACLIGRCFSCFCSWFVLVPLFSCFAFLLRLNQGHPPPPLPSTTSTSTNTNVATSASTSIYYYYYYHHHYYYNHYYYNHYYYYYYFYYYYYYYY